ncbi:MAG: TRAP transporter large permease subunit [Motiliproteus sp.]
MDHPLWLALTTICIAGLVQSALAAEVNVVADVPVVFPLIVDAEFEPIRLGIVAVITVELGLITPPVGMNVFVIKSVSPQIPIAQIFNGVFPFVLSDLVRLALLILFPLLALALALALALI